MMATREQVLAAYAANPRAETNPSEESINYWQNAGLGSFDATVDAVRAANPEFAAQIDALRSPPAGDKATREQVLAAYAANPRAETNPSEASINYWQNAGLGSFDATVDAVRAENPTFAGEIDNLRNLERAKIVENAYQNIGRTGIGSNPNQIDESGYNYWLNELNTGRITPGDFNRVFGSAVSEYVQTRPTDPVTQAVAQYRPFIQPLPNPRAPTTPATPATPATPQQPYTGAFASPGLAGNFANYMSIPIGAQYNPGVTAGGQSPYSQIMAQMPGFTNPYADVVSGMPMGGYNPNIYATEMPRRQTLVNRLINPSTYDESGYGDSGPGAGPGASDGPSAAASASDFGGFNGGLITKVMGPNPPTPDDGTMFVQKGEYIIKKDSVNKYGKGLLDMINDGKIPAKKMKSLLG
jgi:hypothetical protein